MNNVHKISQTSFRASDSPGLDIIVDLLDGMVFGDSCFNSWELLFWSGGTSSSSSWSSSWPSSLLTLSFSYCGGEGGWWGSSWCTSSFSSSWCVPLVDASVSTLGSPCREVEASTWTDEVLSYTSVGRTLPIDKSWIASDGSLSPTSIGNCSTCEPLDSSNFTSTISSTFRVKLL